jgi:hypothetical protein
MVSAPEGIWRAFFNYTGWLEQDRNQASDALGLPGSGLRGVQVDCVN